MSRSEYVLPNYRGLIISICRGSKTSNMSVVTRSKVAVVMKTPVAGGRKTTGEDDVSGGRDVRGGGEV